MRMIKMKRIPLFLLLVTTLLSLGWLAYGYEQTRPGLKTDLDRCIDQCREEEEELSGLFSCAARCERKYSQPGRGGGGSRREREREREQREREPERREEEGERERGREREGEREQRESEREQRERERKRERTEEEREERGGGSRWEREREREQREREPERREEGGGREREGEREQRESEREQRERERQRERREEEREERGGGRGSGGGSREYDRRDSEGQYWDCKEICWRQDESQQPECHTTCRRLYEGVAGGVSKDPDQEYRECEQRCRSQEESQQQPQCLRTCAREYQKRRQEQEQTEQERGGVELNSNHHDPRRRFEECRQQCERQEKGRKQQKCMRSCERQREREEKEEQRRASENNQNPKREKTREREVEKEEEEEQQQQQTHPYHFRSRRFRYRYKSEQGHMRVLPRFTQRSRLFRGIENFRLAVSELNPSSLVVPHHCDAESILAIINGKTIMTLVTQDEKRESYSMERGDLIRIPAGTTIYFINPDNKERLRVVKLIRPVNTPGQFMEYFSAGSENPRSYYGVFSSDILSRSLNTPKEQLERLFAGQQRQQGGVARKATAEQIKSLSGHASPRGRKGSKKSSQGPISLLNEKPRYQNNHGRFFEACPNDYKQLQHMDVSVAFAELNQGAMMVPHYNSRQTTVILVLEGRGRFEMGCPHVSPSQHGESGERREEMEEQEEEEEGSSAGELHKITADVSAGDVFIAPAGHPFTVVVSKNENFSTLSFGINSLNNKRIFITGKNNIMTQVESEVKEIAFNVPAKLVDKIFNENPKESHFTAGPEQQEGERQQEEERSHFLPSILNLVGFI